LALSDWRCILLLNYPGGIVTQRRIYKDITETMGDTPLIQLNRIGRDLPARIVVKHEGFNPFNSVKDRIGILCSEHQRIACQRHVTAGQKANFGIDARLPASGVAHHTASESRKQRHQYHSKRDSDDADGSAQRTLADVCCDEAVHYSFMAPVKSP